jgi:hypothetical protein
LGKAFVITGILGFTIEPWIRRALARDVFSAAFGYTMPDDFKEQLKRIADYKVLCTKHRMYVRIKDASDGHVRVTITVERTFSNIGTSSVPIKAMVWIDELGFNEAVEIHRCEIFNKRGNKVYKFDPSQTKYRNDFAVKVQTVEMWLHPQVIL